MRRAALAALLALPLAGCSVFERLSVALDVPSVGLPADGAVRYARELCQLRPDQRPEFRAVMGSTLGGGVSLDVTCPDERPDER